VDHFDAAIVGAGPAGCRLAWRLARAGVRVAIFDGSHPREKPCGGGVTGRALELVHDAIDTAAIHAVTISDITFEDHSRRAHVVLDPRFARTPQLAVVPRTLFDSALLAAAVRAGATLRAERVRDISWEANAWRIASERQSTRASWVFGADGPNSLVRRRVSRPFERADLSIATGFFVRGVASSTVAIKFEDNPPGYLWSFPRADHLAVGICAQADESRPSALLAAASTWIARNIDGTSARERYSWPIPSLRFTTLERERPSGPQWMLLGDAGGMVDPITREGIFFALVSAEAAADSFLDVGDPGGRYAQRIQSLVYEELMRAALLKSRFFNPPFISLLLHALVHSARIREIMTDLVSGHQPYKGLRRRLLATLQFGLLIEMLKGRRYTF
jgi:geranylgeranyl reductase family protein